MPHDESNDVPAAVACLRASMVAMGITYEGLVLRQGNQTIAQWESYDVPPAAKIAMLDNPDARLVRSFQGGLSEERWIMPIVRPLMTCSPEMLRMVFEGLSEMPQDAAELVEGHDFDRDEVSVTPMTDLELDCPTCGHVGLGREKSWPAVCLAATEALNPGGAEPPPNRLRTLVAITMVCPNCDHAVKRPSFQALKDKAILELMAERLNLSMPIAAKDLRDCLEAQQKNIAETADLLWISMQDYLVDLGDPSDGRAMPPLEKFVAETDAPEWVEIAIAKLETLGCIQNIEGKVFRKIEANQNPGAFSEPLVEHMAFPLQTKH